MSNINLLPWREEAKKQKQREFFIITAGAALVTIMIIMGINVGISSLKSAQDSRNNYLKSEISILDQQIVEIKDIKKRRMQIEERIDLIQKLQVSRNQVTELFNALPTLTPTGVYLSSMQLSGKEISVKGKSEDNTRLVSMLRSIRSSDLFGGTPKPTISNSKGKLSDFSFDFMIDPEKIQEPQSTGGKK